MLPVSENLHIRRPESLLLQSLLSRVSTTAVSILTSLRCCRPCCPTYFLERSSAAISATALVYYPYYHVSLPPPLSSSQVSTTFGIALSSIVLRPSLPLCSCISAVSPLPSVMPFPHLYCCRTHQTCHLLFHFHYPLRLQFLPFFPRFCCPVYFTASKAAMSIIPHLHRPSACIYSAKFYFTISLTHRHFTSDVILSIV